MRLPAPLVTLILLAINFNLSAAQESADPKGDHSATHETRNMRGWVVHINRRLFRESPQKTKTALRLMDVQLKRVVDAVPANAVAELRKVPIWINPQYEGERARAEYHPGEQWLRRNGRDPIMVKAVEVSNVDIFEFENRRMPYLMLHELAHAYHDRVLGFEHPAIVDAFETARDSGTYDTVKRFTGRKMVNDRAYAMSNPKEYFAECSEALFGRNDFYPFNKVELKRHDLQAYKLLTLLWKSPTAKLPTD